MKSKTRDPKEVYERLTASRAQSFEEFYAIYVDSIVERERKTKPQIREIVKRSEYKVLLAKRGKTVLGFSILFAPKAESFCLLEYMAVASAFRNQGIGARVFRHSMKMVRDEHQNTPVLLEVDSDRENSPDRLTRRRRLDFYRRLGCAQVARLHYLMPLPGEGSPPEMDLLIYSFDPLPGVSKVQVELWLKAIYQEVYGCAAEDPRIDLMLRRLTDPVRFV